MRRMCCLGLAVSLVFAGATYGQQPSIDPPSSTSPATSSSPVVSATVLPQPDAPAKYLLKEGDDVSLRFAEGISSKTAEDGDSVELTLDEDLKVGGVIVAKAGCKALGEVTNAEKSGMLGKAGQLNLRLEYLKVGDAKVRLRGSKGKEGQSGTTSAIVLTVLFGPIGLIKHGKNVEIRQGTPLNAFVAEDVTLSPAT